MKSKIFNLSFFSRVYISCVRGEVVSLSASLSYYMLFALFPTLVIFKEILDSFLHVSQPLYNGFMERVPDEVVFIFEELFTSSREVDTGVVAGTVFLSLFAFVRFVRVLKLHFERVYKTRHRTTYVGSWLFSLVLALYFLALLYLSLVIIVFGEQILKVLTSFLGAEEIFVVLWERVRLLLFLCVLLLFLFLIFMFLPGERQSVKDALPGVAFTCIGWILASYLFSLYVNNFSNYSVVYGTLGAFVILMTWLYILCLVILMGANINLSFSRANCAKIRREVERK